MYQFHRTAFLNRMEQRIHLLYSFLEKHIMPWQWDWQNYTGDNADMYGYFYPEDIEAIKGIQYFESQYKPPSK